MSLLKLKSGQTFRQQSKVDLKKLAADGKRDDVKKLTIMIPKSVHLEFKNMTYRDDLLMKDVILSLIIKYMKAKKDGF